MCEGLRTFLTLVPESRLLCTNTSTFVQCELRALNSTELVFQDPSNPLASALFRCGNKANDVTVERIPLLGQAQECRHACGQHALVIDCAATVQVAVAHSGFERWCLPLLQIHTNYIQVSHDENSLLARVRSVEMCDEVGSSRSHFDDLHLYSRNAGEDRLEILRGTQLIAWRILGVNADEFDEIRLRVALRLRSIKSGW